MVDAGKRY